MQRSLQVLKRKGVECSVLTWVHAMECNASTHLMTPTASWQINLITALSTWQGQRPIVVRPINVQEGIQSGFCFMVGRNRRWNYFSHNYTFVAGAYGRGPNIGPSSPSSSGGNNNPSCQVVDCKSPPFNAKCSPVDSNDRSIRRPEGPKASCCPLLKCTEQDGSTYSFHGTQIKPSRRASIGWPIITTELQGLLVKDLL